MNLSLNYTSKIIPLITYNDLYRDKYVIIIIIGTNPVFIV